MCVILFAKKSSHHEETFLSLHLERKPLEVQTCPSFETCAVNRCGVFVIGLRALNAAALIPISTHKQVSTLSLTTHKTRTRLRRVPRAAALVSTSKHGALFASEKFTCGSLC